MHSHNCWCKINFINLFLIQYELKSSCYFIRIIQVPKKSDAKDKRDNAASGSGSGD